MELMTKLCLNAIKAVALIASLFLVALGSYSLIALVICAVWDFEFANSFGAIMFFSVITYVIMLIYVSCEHDRLKGK